MPRRPIILDTLPALRAATARIRTARETIALVPTMGALHAGHLDLVHLAKSKATRVVVSIFVNPAQFAPHEDFDRYPRDLAADAEKLSALGVDYIWAPKPLDMYPPGFATRIVPEGAALGLESDFRPHFFGGVATVCCKLFTQVGPDFAVFGEKDYQQLAVVRQLVRDLNLPLAILGCPTTRDPDGLALSSRNAYLTTTERAAAPALHRALQACAAALRSGARPGEATGAASAAVLAAGFDRVDYIAARDAETLAEASADGRALRLLAAVWLGKTRLLDNVPV